MTDMRVAQVCPKYHPYIGGVETHVRMICERLAGQGFSVEVLCTDPEGRLPGMEVINGVVVRRFKSWAPGEAYYLSLGLDRFLREQSQNYDLVHAHNYQALPALSAARNKKRNLLFFTPHYHRKGHTPFRSLLRKLYKPLGKKVFDHADRIFSVSRYEKRLLLKDFGIEDNKIEVIPNGVNLKEFSDHEKSMGDGMMILSVGRLERYKGMQHLVRVLPLLNTDVSLRIVGKGPYRDELENLIRRLGLEDRVSISGGLARSDLLQMYADADLFALLSTEEAYGISVAEALASGTPCVVANESGLSEWVDGKNCLGVEVPPDYVELADLMRELMGNRVSEISFLDWDEVTERLLKSYIKMM